MAGSPAEPRRAIRPTLLTALVALLALAALASACSGGEDAARDRPDNSVEGATTQRPPTTGDGTTSSTTTTVPVPARPSAGCGRASAREVPTGEVESAIDSGGETRTFFIRVPPAHDGTTPVPLVVDFHGFSEGARIHTAFSGLPDLGMDEGFVTVTPQGSGPSAFWNTFGLRFPDDVGFVRALLDDLDDTLCVDLARTYAAGMSNGAFMASLLACRMGDRFAAVAPVAGAQDPVPCTPDRPVPVIAFHGTADTYVLFDGGLGEGVRALGVDPDISLPVLEDRSVPEVLAVWAGRNGCDATPRIEEVADDVQRFTWTGCGGGADVQLYVIEGGGHSWPGSEVSVAAEAMIGPTTRSVRADELIWEFFRDHPMR